MSSLTPTQERFRSYVEELIRLAEPGLNLLLNVGDRVSRVVGTDDPEPLAVPPPDPRTARTGPRGQR